MKKTTTRYKILTYLQKRGGMTVDELCKVLGIGPTAVRQHMAGLLNDGLVEFKELRQEIGRPRFVYALTEEAHDIFPKSYHILADSLIDAVKALYGEEGIDRVFEQIGQTWIANHQDRMKGKDLQGRIREMVKILDEQGFLPELEKNAEGYILREYNCPSHRIAIKYPYVCEMVLCFLSKLLDAEVIRTHCIRNGDPYSAYHIRIRPS
jgi:predicted ArsR family transcriptional regulator